MKKSITIKQFCHFNHSDDDIIYRLTNTKGERIALVDDKTKVLSMKVEIDDDLKCPVINLVVDAPALQ